MCRNTVITKILRDEGAFGLNIKTKIILLMTTLNFYFFVVVGKVILF